jgi:hypothetical protein
MTDRASASKEGVPVVLPEHFVGVDVLWFPQFGALEIWAGISPYAVGMEGAHEKMTMGIEATPIAVFDLCHRCILFFSTLAQFVPYNHFSLDPRQRGRIRHTIPRQDTLTIN